MAAGSSGADGGGRWAVRRARSGQAAKSALAGRLSVSSGLPRNPCFHHVDQPELICFFIKTQWQVVLPG